MLRRTTVSLFLAASFVSLVAGSALAASPSSPALRVSAPAVVDSGMAAPLTLRLPAGVAAVDGRVFLDTSVAQVVGVAATNRGTALTPQEFATGYAFGAYGMRGATAAVLTISIASDVDGRLPYRIVLDAAADGMGNRVTLGRFTVAGAVSFGTASATFATPQGASPRLAPRAPGLVRDLVPDGRLAVTDIDVVRAGWESKRANDNPCTGDSLGADANGDGCVDVVDVQAVLAHQAWNVVNGVAVAPASANGSAPNHTDTSTAGLTAPTPLTFVVTSTSDSVDANPGDGVCADSRGRCTLRAAVTEANWADGPNTIDFNLPGTAPVTIQLSTSLPQLLVQDRTGGTLIDGYSQPGSHVNTSTYASNAVPGVYLVGTGNSPKLNGFRITSAGNTIRGFVFNNNDRTIVIDGTDAHGNVIAGDWLNYNRDGSPTSYRGHYNIWIANGATHNQFGTPALADRNVSGSATKGSAMYGPGTDYNTIQNNLLCMTPSGTSTATCDVGTDYSFGPKHNLIGGTDAGDRNVYGASTQQCIEFAHDNAQNTTDDWKNEYNSIVGNWLGFRADGSYSSSFRCGSNVPSTRSNDSNAINMADGSSYNTADGNWIASWYDGVNIMSGNETGNFVHGNVIGQSPQGQSAPLGRYGVNFRTHARGHQVIGNTIRNTASYGVAVIGSDITHITISQNVITDTSTDAINLVTGANGGIQPPNVSAATTVHVTGTGLAGATVEVYKASRNSGQSGLPTAFVGTTTVASDGSWDAPVTGIASGDRVTALQTSSIGNTSQLSTNVTATFQAPPPKPSANFTWSQVSGFTVAFTDSSTGAVGSWAWDFGDGSRSTQQSPGHTYGAAGTYSVKLTVTNSGGSDSKTQQVNVQATPPVAADGFGRTVATAWGSADVGGAYTLQGSASNYAVNGSAGTMSLVAGSTRGALLGATSAQNVDVTFRVAANKVATGGSYIAYAVARQSGTNEYRAKLTFKSDGSVQVGATVVAGGTETAFGTAVTVAGLTQAANGYIRVHAQFLGTSPTTVNVRAWTDGQAEPATWQFTATDSTAGVQGAGSVGLRAWAGANVSNAPVTLSFDDYSATQVTP